MTKPRTLRCAIYTRKSSEEGLEQDFNSLHAQRDACEAYVLSQAGEGWTALPTAYDDGGISGGTMERPGLKALLADIAARKVDVVVVYKVDRLTRSLADFAKIVEVFDQNQVSFVSVTQSFNTTSSMGRLTLNMLLSFAQFEREVTSERIRDKIAASKKKGMWMGGNLPLGYDADGRTLRINEAEAETVRHIFRVYVELRSVHLLAEELRDQGIRPKRRQTKAGAWIGGEVFTRGALFHLLTNRVYLGMVPHKKEAYPGLHKPILDQQSFDAAQRVLESNRIRRTSGSVRRTQSALMGKLFDEHGQAMTPSFAYGRGGKRYRYYVTGLTGDNGSEPARRRRVPGPEIEALIADLARRTCPTPESELSRVQLRKGGVELAYRRPEAMHDSEWQHRAGMVQAHLTPEQRAWTDPKGLLIVFSPASVVFRGGRSWVIGAEVQACQRPDRAMVTALRRGHRIAAQIGLPPLDGSPREERAIQNTYERRLATLAFLAPDIQQALVTGQHPRTLTLSALDVGDLPLCWSDQRRLFGFK